jgi:hypothetical protein
LFGGGGQVGLAAPPVANSNQGALQTAMAFAGCNADLTPVCTGTGVGCNQCNPLARLGSTASWSGAFGQICTYGLFDFTAYAVNKGTPLTPLCIANCNCTLTMSNPASTAAPAWGTSMRGAAVNNITAYTSAVSDLRTWAGHNPSNAGSWAYPPPYALMNWWNNQFDQTGFSWQVSSSAQDAINAVSANLGFRPLVVSHLGCGSFSFSTIDPTSATYWAEHWELYKFTYANAQWLYSNNITKVELHNEADLSQNNACMNPGNSNTIATAAAFNTATGNNMTVYQYVNAYWADYFAVRSVATQDAYADANADVAAGNMACPFPGACPITISIYGSAYALSANPPASTPTSSHQFGGAMLQNAYFRFPCTASTCTPNTANWRGSTGISKTSSNFPWGVDTSFSTFHVYSYHRCGVTRVPPAPLSEPRTVPSAPRAAAVRAVAAQPTVAEAPHAALRLTVTTVITATGRRATTCSPRASGTPTRAWATPTCWVPARLPRSAGAAPTAAVPPTSSCPSPSLSTRPSRALTTSWRATAATATSRRLAWPPSCWRTRGSVRRPTPLSSRWCARRRLQPARGAADAVRGCRCAKTPSGSTSGTPSAVTVVSKHGLHFAENLNTNSMQIGDQTAGGAAFALIAPYVTGGKQLLQCSMADTTAKFTWPPTTTSASLGLSCALLKDGNVYRLFLAMDCNGTPARQKAGVTGDTGYCSDRQFTIPLSSLAPSPSSVVSISEVSAPANYCINPNGLKDATSGGTRLCTDPAFAKYNTLYPSSTAVLGGNMNPFSNVASASGYFGEVSRVVPLNSSIISSGLVYTLPTFGVARIDIPINAQVKIAPATMLDVSLMAGANADSVGGQLFNLTASISSTMVHDSTSAILMQFNTSTFSSANLAHLSMTLLNPPNKGNVILQVVGVNPTAPPVWNEGVATWNTLSYLLGKPTGLVQSIGDNFVQLGPSNRNTPSAGTWNYLIGHISVSANDPPGSVKTLDITKFVQMAQAAKACTVNIAVVRRFRRNVQSPADASGCIGSAGCPAGSPIGMTLPADSLAGGAVAFYSQDFPNAAVAPRLAVYADATSPVQQCSPASQLNTTVSTTMYVTGITSTGASSGRRSLLATGAPLHLALNATAQAVAATLGLPANGVYVSQVNFTTIIAISFSQSSVNGQPTVPFKAAEVGAAFNSLASTGSYLGSFFNGSTVPGGSSTDTATAVSSEYFTSMGITYSPAAADALNAMQASAGNAFTKDLVSWRNSLPAGMMDMPSAHRRKLLQNGFYTVTLTFDLLEQADNFLAYMSAGSGLADLTSYMNANYGNSLIQSNLVFEATVAAGVVVDVYAPYHSPSSADSCFYALQDSQRLNNALDSVSSTLSGRRRLLQTSVGDAVDLVVDNQPPTVNPGWSPQGTSAPAAAPELIIVVASGSQGSSGSGGSRTYTQGDMIGLGVGLGVGEFLLFTAIVIFLVFKLKQKPAAPAGFSSTEAVAAAVENPTEKRAVNVAIEAELAAADLKA